MHGYALHPSKTEKARIFVVIIKYFNINIDNYGDSQLGRLVAQMRVFTLMPF